MRMQEIVWHERFSVGVPSMDAQHKHLIELLNGLRSSNDENTAYNTIMSMFDYARIHFRDEESLLRQAGYSELPAQILEHRRFLSKAESFSKQAISDPDLCTQLISFLHNWLLHHILEEDMKYKRCIPDYLTR